MINELLRPILDDGLRSINFFNGRLLSGEDLSEEQAANRHLHRRLGRALGEGIAYGLQVTEPLEVSLREKRVVTVKKGLAINRAGQTLSLPADTDVSLVHAANGNGAAPAGMVFAECQPPQPGVYVAGAGVYLLTLAPASGVLGRAPVNGLGNTSAACNARYNVEGVQFRLIRLELTSTELSDTARLRNRVAYKCLGVEAPGSFHSNPFGPPIESYGLLDDLRLNRLTDCDVPLAVMHWTAAGGLTFIDQWSVRRRLTPPSIAERWGPTLGSRRASEAEAMFLQFADQVRDIRLNETNLESIAAADRFEFLPPVGLLPLAGPGALREFSAQAFFRNLTVRDPIQDPVYIEGAVLNALIREALAYPPIHLTNNNKELIWLYRVRENQQTIDAGGPNLPGAYLVFTHGHVPYRGEARFDLNYWNYSNFA